MKMQIEKTLRNKSKDTVNINNLIMKNKDNVNNKVQSSRSIINNVKINDNGNFNKSITLKLKNDQNLGNKIQKSVDTKDTKMKSSNRIKIQSLNLKKKSIFTVPSTELKNTYYYFSKNDFLELILSNYYYMAYKTLGSGSYGVVYKCKKKFYLEDYIHNTHISLSNSKTLNVNDFSDYIKEFEQILKLEKEKNYAVKIFFSHLNPYQVKKELNILEYISNFKFMDKGILKVIDGSRKIEKRKLNFIDEKELVLPLQSELNKNSQCILKIQKSVYEEMINKISTHSNFVEVRYLKKIKKDYKSKSLDKSKLNDSSFFLNISKDNFEKYNKIQNESEDLVEKSFNLNENSIFFVSELGNNIEFIEILKESNRNLIKAYIFSLIKTVNCLHKIGISHRDIKPDNFLFFYDKEKIDFSNSFKKNSLNNIECLLIDFGLSDLCLDMPSLSIADIFEESNTLLYKSIQTNCSTNYTNQENSNLDDYKSHKTQDIYKEIRKNQIDHNLFRKSGTRGFMAPEMIFNWNLQDTKVDVWSIGVILLSLVVKKYPLLNMNKFSVIKDDNLKEICLLVLLFGKTKVSLLSQMCGKMLIIPDSYSSSINENNMNEDFTIKNLINCSSFPKDEHLEDLILKLMAFFPFERINLDEALKHKWFD